jgi:hypothetical protein
MGKARIEAGSGPEQQIVKRSDMVFVPAQSYLGDFGDMGTVRRETEPVLDLAEPRRLQPITGDRAEVRRILNRNTENAGSGVLGSDPEMLEPRGKPTPSGRDASFKINALESAAKLVDNDELGKMLTTPVGSAVEQLYKANKAKGNQTDKELLGYIAKEFPRVEDQKTAATALFGLSYKDQLSGKLG